MLTRRKFIGTPLVAGAALTTSAQQARPQPASKRTIVDAQETRPKRFELPTPRFVAWCSALRDGCHVDQPESNWQAGPDSGRSSRLIPT